jgi:hypothetical protein
MRRLQDRRLVRLLLSIICSLQLLVNIAYADNSWIDKLAYTIDNDTYVVGESEWSELKYDAFQSAFLDGLNKLNVMRNTEIQTTYVEKAYDGKVSSQEFSKIKSSTDYGKISVKDSHYEHERISGLHRVFLLMKAEPKESFFDMSRWFDYIKNLFSFN